MTSWQEVNLSETHQIHRLANDPPPFKSGSAR